MKLSSLIELLQAMLERHGDVDVWDEEREQEVGEVEYRETCDLETEGFRRVNIR